MSRSIIFPNYIINTVSNSDEELEVIIQSYVRVKALDGRYFLVKLIHKENIKTYNDISSIALKNFIKKALNLMYNYNVTTEMIEKCNNNSFDLSLLLDENQEEESKRLKSISYE